MSGIHADLLSDLDKFKKRALNYKAVERKERNVIPHAPGAVERPAAEARKGSAKKADAQVSKQLYAIVKLLKERKGQAVTLLDIYNAKKIDVGGSAALFEAVQNNPKIQVNAGGAGADGAMLSLTFRPMYAVGDKNELLRLLRDFHRLGHGGVELDNLKEGFPDVEAAVRELAADKLAVAVKRKNVTLLFYRDSTYDLLADDEYKELWRQVKVPVITEVERALDKAGIETIKTQVVVRQKKGSKKRGGGGIRKLKTLHNAHVTYLDYSAAMGGGPGSSSTSKPC